MKNAFALSEYACISANLNISKEKIITEIRNDLGLQWKIQQWLSDFVGFSFNYKFKGFFKEKNLSSQHVTFIYEKWAFLQ